MFYMITDLHIHSHYSQATSQNMNLVELSRNAKIKGIDVLGTGDFTHPLWLKELKENLSDDGDIYSYNGVNFILQGEISLIYNQVKMRKIHLIILAPSFEVVDQINEYLKKHGRLDYDGRPTFGISCIELTENLMSISKEIEIIPAHCMTPWFGIFGSMSGFDSIKECFEDKTKYIHAVETGMSADPPMLWRISELDDFSLVSNSDSHSPHPYRIGREANVFSCEPKYKNIINAIRTRKNFLFTIEVNPAYGKYHFDGHRNCNFSCSPEESKKLKNICPICKKPLTIGVLNRVEQLADREEGFRPKGAVDFKSIIPLSEIISLSTGYNIFTKKVSDIYNKLIENFGTEFKILLDAEEKELKKIVDERLANLIIKNRLGKIKVIPGYDGVYGRAIEKSVNQKTLRDL